MTELPSSHESISENRRPNKLGEAALRQFEISHQKRAVDITLNRDAELAPEWGTRLRETFRDGLPSDWKNIEGVSSHVTMGEIDGKQFIAKMKIRRLERGDAQMSAEQWAKTFVAPREAVYAEESMLNEMSLSPQIKAALATHEVREKVRKLGFDEVFFVEPIIGVVERASDSQGVRVRGAEADKFLVYEYVAGDRPEPNEGKMLKEIVDEALRKASIEAGDLRGDQFLIDGDKVHLLDAELYRPLQAPIEQAA
jgi:hypothetical protein